MKESQPYELPNCYEKLSFKFILDEIKDKQREQTITEPAENLQATAEVAPTETQDAPNEAPAMELTELKLPEGKKYFRIGEVSDLIGVESYVLRYWENEFKTVRPVKSKTGHRVYSANDVRALHLIRHLLHVEKFSVKGAKKKLQELRKKPVMVSSAAANRQRESLKHLLSELKQLAQLARNNPGNL